MRGDQVTRRLGAGGLLTGALVLLAASAAPRAQARATHPPASAPRSAAWHETLLYVFSGGNDGSNPQAGLTVDEQGNLYGTTLSGGSGTSGVTFELVPPAQASQPWTETILHAFGRSIRDGQFPDGPVVRDASGTLYGTTENGGLVRLGMMYSLSPPPSGSFGWTEHILRVFDSFDGGYPTGAMTLGQDGGLYGTSLFGGDFAAGNVYELDPPVKGERYRHETRIFSFDGSNGANPTDGPILDVQGNLYGTTEGGGPSSGCQYGCGVAYELSRPSSQHGIWSCGQHDRHGRQGGD